MTQTTPEMLEKCKQLKTVSDWQARVRRMAPCHKMFPSAVTEGLLAAGLSIRADQVGAIYLVVDQDSLGLEIASALNLPGDRSLLSLLGAYVVTPLIDTRRVDLLTEAVHLNFTLFAEPDLEYRLAAGYYFSNQIVPLSDDDFLF